MRDLPNALRQLGCGSRGLRRVLARAFAAELARRGMHLLLIARRGDALQAVGGQAAPGSRH